MLRHSEGGLQPRPDEIGEKRSPTTRQKGFDASAQDRQVEDDTLRRSDGKRSGPVSAMVWDSVPGRPGEAWLTHVRPVVRLECREDGHVYGLIGAVHAALEGAGLLSGAQRFVGQAYYLGSYAEVLELAKEYVEVR